MVKQLSPRTAADYRYVFNILPGRFGKDLVYRIASGDIEKWLAKQKRWTPRTRNKYVSTLRTFYRWCIKRGYAVENPAVDVDKVRENKYENRILTEAEETRLLEACRQPFRATCKGFRQGRTSKSEWKQEFVPPENLYPIVLIALRTGLRYGAIALLKWRHIDWENAVILPKARSILIPEDIDEIRFWMQQNDHQRCVDLLHLTVGATPASGNS